MIVPAERTQVDGLGDEYSAATALDFTRTTVITRQEFTNDADINVLLKRFGVNTPIRTDARYTDIDYNLDLQQALAAVAAARGTLSHVPPELRGKYPTWEAVLHATESGHYQSDLQTLQQRKAAAAEREEKAKKWDEKESSTKEDTAAQKV